MQCLSTETLEERYHSYVTLCTEPYIAMAPLLDDIPDLLAWRQHELIRRHFGSDLYAMQEHAIATLSSWPAWRVLTVERGCSHEAAKRVLAIGLKRLVK